MLPPRGWKYVGRVLIPGLTLGWFSAAVWAQPPVATAVPGPPPPMTTTPATVPGPPVGYSTPATYVPGPRPGPDRTVCEHVPPLGYRVVHGAGAALQDGMIGYPDLFYEPPLGAYVNTQFNMMRAKANPHRFTLYRTDFLKGSNQFSPVGATRLNLMASRLGGWQGPIVIEWSPDEPGMAEARRAAVLATFEKAGMPLGPDRVVVAPSPFPGALGADSGNYYNIMLNRDATAPQQYTYSPTSASGFGAGGGGGGGGAGPR